MSTRSTIRHHIDDETGVKIHIFSDMLDEHEQQWIEIRTPTGETLVKWPFGVPQMSKQRYELKGEA